MSLYFFSMLTNVQRDAGLQELVICFFPLIAQNWFGRIVYVFSVVTVTVQKSRCHC